MIPPGGDTEDRQTLVDIAHDAGDGAQHGAFVLPCRHPKLQRHGALVVLPEWHVNMRGWPGITQ